jgi:orotate phosphoribosyltransferase
MGKMEPYKQEFITFMVQSGVLTFGDFTTKSGRKTPFFINTGNYKTGGQIARLGEFYAQALRANIGNDFDVLFGPAYKGIPLAVSTAIALATKHNHSVPYCFNRKEAKDHGEGGSIVGHKPADGDRIVIIDDVTTSGASVRESAALLTSIAKVVLSALVVSVDRMEKGQTDKGALAEIRQSFGMKTFAIVTLTEIVEYLYNKNIDGTVLLDDTIKKRIDEYRKQYGITSFL